MNAVEENQTAGSGLKPWGDPVFIEIVECQACSALREQVERLSARLAVLEGVPDEKLTVACGLRFNWGAAPPPSR